MTWKSAWVLFYSGLRTGNIARRAPSAQLYLYQLPPLWSLVSVMKVNTVQQCLRADIWKANFSPVVGARARANLNSSSCPSTATRSTALFLSPKSHLYEANNTEKKSAKPLKTLKFSFAMTSSNEWQKPCCYSKTEAHHTTQYSAINSLCFPCACIPCPILHLDCNLFGARSTTRPVLVHLRRRKVLIHSLGCCRPQ